MLSEGFLGTAAPRAADLVLLLEIAMGAGLLIGAWFARHQRFRPHAWCQSVVVLLNLAVVAMLMIPSFRAQVLPRIPAKLGKPYFALATMHATLGTVTELAGLYILLSVGTSVLPDRLRINEYKLWMRSVLVLWWAVLLLGVATYTRWYVPHLFGTRFADRAYVPWFGMYAAFRKNRCSTRRDAAYYQDQCRVDSDKWIVGSGRRCRSRVRRRWDFRFQIGDFRIRKAGGGESAANGLPVSFNRPVANRSVN